MVLLATKDVASFVQIRTVSSPLDVHCAKTTTSIAAMCWVTGQFILPQGHPNFAFEPKNMVVTSGYEARGIRTESNKLDMRYAMHIDVSELFNWSVKEVL
jgi:hypothetical protein